MTYPKFSVPGVPEDQIWQLFNASNFEYYLEKVAGLQAGICPFCQIDPDRNKVISIPNNSWLAWPNRMAAKQNQSLQLVILSKRHIERVEDLGPVEWINLGNFITELAQHFKLEGFSLLCRSGNPLFNAKSVPHLHFNLHVPDGTGKVAPTIGKSWHNLEEKLRVLTVFEKLRLLVTKNLSLQAALASLPVDEQLLVKDQLLATKAG